MKLHGYFLSPIRLHKANWLITIKGNLCVRSVMADRYLVLASKFNRSVEKIKVSYGAGGIIRIVYPQKLSPFCDVLRYTIKNR